MAVSFERRAVASLSLLYAFRMLGLFMVLPVLSLYGQDYQNASPQLLGLALGIYGLSQACLQVPFGMLSDRYGRKPLIVIGLLIFALGSVVAALSETIWGLIIGRALQGGGAIASVIMALVADLTSEENRTKAMASIGASIGLSFSVALILGPAVAAAGGLEGIFWLTALLAILGLLVLMRVPTPQLSGARHRDAGAIPALLWSTFRQPELMRLNLGIFVLHAVLMASFLTLPVMLESQLNLHRSDHWQVYLPLLSLAFVVMVPFMIIAEKQRKIKPVFVAAVGLLALALVGQWLNLEAGWWYLLAVFVFFVAFNLLEATLPSLVSKIAPAGRKGTATGIYSTWQFSGAFVGGAGGGWLMAVYGVSALYWACVLLVGCWFVAALSMAKPRFLTSLCVPLGASSWQQAQDALSQVEGVAEVVVIREEAVAYLKVDGKCLDRAELCRVQENLT